MTRYFRRHYPIVLAFVIAIGTITVSGTAFAQKSGPGTAKQNSASLIRAKRIMRKLDKDGNGTFEKQENEKAWKRLRKLDTNRDQVLTIDELRKQRIAYLPSDGERKLNIVYKNVSNRNLLLDLYYPAAKGEKGNSGFPVVVYTHGGGWAAGSKQGIARGLFKTVFQKLLKHGFAVASVNYRLCRRQGVVTIRDCVIDVKDAVRYLAKHSETLKLDRRRFFAMGDSAGGQLAQMLVLSSPETLPGDENLASAGYTMVAGVSWYGPCDFEKVDLFNHDDRKDFRDRFGSRILNSKSKPGEKQARYREVSPVNYLKKDSPPLLMIQGDKDTTIPVKHAYYMKQRAQALQAPVEIMIIRNSGHNWRKVGAEIEPSREAIVDRTVKFFLDHRRGDANSR